MTLDPEALAARLAAQELDPLHPEAGEREAAVAMILRFHLTEPEVLLMRRTEHPEDRWSGQISLPGGHRDPGDDDLLFTAIRESREEVGLDLAREARSLGRLPRVQGKARGRSVPLSIFPFVFHATGDGDPTPGVEAQEVFWFPLRRAASGELASTHRYHRGEAIYELPSWTYEGRVVWGLTYEMLGRLVRVAGWSGA